VAARAGMECGKGGKAENLGNLRKLGQCGKRGKGLARRKTWEMWARRENVAEAGNLGNVGEADNVRC